MQVVGALFETLVISVKFEHRADERAPCACKNFI
jgi:hypothetical protein